MVITNSLKTANEFLKAGKLDCAYKEYQRLIELRPNLAWNYYYLGQLFFLQGKLPEAVTQYRHAIKLNPNSGTLHNSLATTLIQKGELDDAIHHSQKAIFLRSDLATYYQTLTLAYEAKSDFQQALQTWQKTVAINPKLFEAKFQQVLNKNPNYFTVLLNDGIFASQQKNRQLALEKFELIIKYYPYQKSIDAYILAATELKYLGRLDESEEKYEQALNLQKNRPFKQGFELIGTALTSIQEVGLLLDRLPKKQPDTVEGWISFARLIDRRLFLYPWAKSYSAPIAKDAPSLLSNLRLLKKRLEHFQGLDASLLERFNLAIQILEKESQKLNSNEWVKIELIHPENLPLTNSLCFDDLNSSATYLIPQDEPLKESKIQATVQYLPELMDEEKEYFEDSIRKMIGRVQPRNQQSVNVLKDFIVEPPFGIANGYISDCYDKRVFKSFVDDLIDKSVCRGEKHTDIVAKNVFTLEQISDPRGFLEEIAVSKKALNNYYEDNVVFGLAVLGHIWGAYQNYGHFLFDEISGLILYQKLNLSCKIFVPHITDNHWEIFNHLNIPKEKILVKQEQKFKYFIIGRYKFDAEIVNFYRNLRESIVSKRGDVPSEYRARYVYISRRYAERRKMANEAEVEELMASLGFSIVYGERLSFEEKAMLMHHTSMLVSPWGSGIMACALMCDPSTHVITIFPPNANLNVMPNLYDCLIWVLGKHHAYNLLGEQAPDGWRMNINKLKKVITTILENS